MPVPRSLLVATLALVACTSKPSGSDDVRDSTRVLPAEVVATAVRAADSTALDSLDRAARAMVDSGGCSDSSQCAVAAVGVRGCGGPRDFVVYCRLTTDSAALFAKLDELSTAERAFNTKYQIASNCDMRLPPPTQLVGRVCRVK